MKEKDIRDHITAFLRTKLQSLVVPASMGLGMVVGGCSDSPLSANPDGSGDVQPGSGGGGGSLPPGTGGAGGTLYGIGGIARGGAGGSGGIGTLYGAGGAGGGGGSRVVPGSGGIYGIGASWGGGAGGGMGGMGGTVYGTGGARDASPSDTRQMETGESPDSLTSEAGAVEPRDALPSGPEIL